MKYRKMFGSRNKPQIKVHVKVAGFIDQKMTTAEFELGVPEGTSVKKLFSLIDKSGKVKGKVMKKIMAMPKTPTVLINGSGIDVPDELDREVCEGDEVAVMTPMAGG